MDDHDLIEACQAGCEDAWQQLYQRHQPRLWCYFRTLARTNPDADFEELCQDTWETVVRWIGRFEIMLPGTAVFFPWLAVVARHRYIAMLRRKMRRVQVVYDPPELDDPINVEQTAIGRVFARYLLQQLPDPLNRHVLELRMWHDLAWSEVGAVLGLPTVTVKHRYEDAIWQLRGVLSGIVPRALDASPAKSLSPERRTEARLRYMRGELGVHALAQAYGVAPGTMESYVRGAKRITCARCQQVAAPSGVSSRVCAPCHAEMESRDERWCVVGAHAAPLALFRAKGGPCRDCNNRIRRDRQYQQRRDKGLICRKVR